MCEVKTRKIYRWHIQGGPLFQLLLIISNIKNTSVKKTRPTVITIINIIGFIHQEGKKEEGVRVWINILLITSYFTNAVILHMGCELEEFFLNKNTLHSHQPLFPYVTLYLRWVDIKSIKSKLPFLTLFLVTIQKKREIERSSSTTILTKLLVHHKTHHNNDFLIKEHTWYFFRKGWEKRERKDRENQMIRM